MNEYLIYATVTISTYTRVYAETLEDAIEIASDRSPMSVTPNGGDNEYESWMVDEIDGTPYDLHQ